MITVIPTPKRFLYIATAPVPSKVEIAPFVEGQISQCSAEFMLIGYWQDAPDYPFPIDENEPEILTALEGVSFTVVAKLPGEDTLMTADSDPIDPVHGGRFEVRFTYDGFLQNPEQWEWFTLAGPLPPERPSDNVSIRIMPTRKPIAAVIGLAWKPDGRVTSARRVAVGQNIIWEARIPLYTSETTNPRKRWRTQTDTVFSGNDECAYLKDYAGFAAETALGWKIISEKTGAILVIQFHGDFSSDDPLTLVWKDGECDSFPDLDQLAPHGSSAPVIDMEQQIKCGYLFKQQEDEDDDT